MHNPESGFDKATGPDFISVNHDENIDGNLTKAKGRGGRGGGAGVVYGAPKATPRRSSLVSIGASRSR